MYERFPECKNPFKMSINNLNRSLWCDFELYTERMKWPSGADKGTHLQQRAGRESGPKYLAHQKAIQKDSVVDILLDRIIEK
jgi:hypothetical protein